MMLVHDTAMVEDGATVGKGTRVWHHAHIRSGATVGNDCVLGKNVYIDEGVNIGDRVKIQNNVSVFKGVTIRDDVFVGPNTVFTNDRVPRSSNPNWELVPTEVARGASIGAGSVVVCGVEIGEWAMVGAGAVVTHTVDPHRLVVGVPARPAGWVCVCGRIISRELERPHALSCGLCATTGRD